MCRYAMAGCFLGSPCQVWLLGLISKAALMNQSPTKSCAPILDKGGVLVLCVTTESLHSMLLIDVRDCSLPVAPLQQHLAASFASVPCTIEHCN